MLLKEKTLLGLLIIFDEFPPPHSYQSLTNTCNSAPSITTLDPPITSIVNSHLSELGPPGHS